MAFILALFVIGLLITYYYINHVLEYECPVCGSKKRWSAHYFGIKKDYVDLYCNKCHQSLYNPTTGECTTFTTPQHFL